MIYAALDSFQRHFERVRRRAARGGHAASESTLRRIHQSSLANLSIALDPERSSIDDLRVFDNSADEKMPNLNLDVKHGRIVHISDEFPPWLQATLHLTDLDIERIRTTIRPAPGE